MNEDSNDDGSRRIPSPARARPRARPPDRWRRWYLLSAHHKLENDEKADSGTKEMRTIIEGYGERREYRILKKYRTVLTQTKRMVFLLLPKMDSFYQYVRCYALRD